MSTQQKQPQRSAPTKQSSSEELNRRHEELSAQVQEHLAKLRGKGNLPVPTAGLLASVVVSPWVDSTPHGAAAFLLIAHPPAKHPHVSAGTIEADMRGLSDALGLAPVAARLPYIGPRLTMRGTTAVLGVDRCDYRLGATVGATWSRFVADGGPVVVALGLDPLDRGSGRDSVEAYLGRCTLSGRLLVGVTGHVQRRGLG